MLIASDLQVRLQRNCQCLSCDSLYQNLMQTFCVFWFDVISSLEPATELN